MTYQFGLCRISDNLFVNFIERVENKKKDWDDAEGDNLNNYNINCIV